MTTIDKRGRGFSRRKLAFFSAVGLMVAASLGPAAAQQTGGDGRVAGGTLRVYTEGFSVDPRQSWSTAAHALTDSLVDRNPDTLEFVPWLAESWKVNEDATEYTFTLREGVTFSNGDVLDSRVVKANFDGAVADLKAGGGWYIRGVFDHYVGTEIIDDRTFKVKFSVGNGPFLANVSTDQLGIIHPDDFKKTLDERKNYGIVGTGPFVIKSVTPRAALRLDRRDDYNWSSKLARHQGPASIEAVELTVVPERGTREGALQSGEADLITVPTPEGVVQLPRLGYKVAWRQQTGLGKSLNVNFKSDKLNQLELRQAVLKAIDRKELSDLVAGPASRAAGSILASSTFGYHDFSGDLLAYDPEGAKKLLDSIGWVVKESGFRERDGKRLTLNLVWDDSHTTEEFVTLLRDQFARVGIELTLTFRKISQASADFREGKFDFWYQNGTRADPDVLRKTYSNAGAALDATVRYGDSAEVTGSTELEEVLQATNTVADSPERAELVKKAQEILIKYAFRIPVEDNPQVVIATAKDLEGLRFSPLGEPVFYDIWLKR
ncbi:MAG: ABC transporter substrate-binding protein [Pseudochelatococcus sp.]|jgi:peptide/nickel transport system substrate-binding protein|uniref:ABC transporter substrate-binding protein n=1 Tax=Pseudochelatococcus sp. TaxID=2020869 RepID=UPI003D8C74C9